MKKNYTTCWKNCFCVLSILERINIREEGAFPHFPKSFLSLVLSGGSERGGERKRWTNGGDRFLSPACRIGRSEGAGFGLSPEGAGFGLSCSDCRAGRPRVSSGC